MAKSGVATAEVVASPQRVISDISPNKRYGEQIIKIINSLIARRQKLIDAPKVNGIGFVFFDDFGKELAVLDDFLNSSDFYRISNTKKVIVSVINKLKDLSRQVADLPLSAQMTRKDVKKLEDAERDRRNVLRDIRTLGVEGFLVGLQESLSQFRLVKPIENEGSQKQSLWKRLFGN